MGTLWSLIHGVILIFVTFQSPRACYSPSLINSGNQDMNENEDDVDRNVFTGVFDDCF